MKLLPILFLLSILCALVSCERNVPTLSIFTEADSLLAGSSERALALLQDVDANDLSASQQAEYALLLTQAMDKQDIPFTNDSLIMLAVNYYKNRPQKKDRQAKAYYYLGRVYETLGDDVEAAKAYLDALTVMGDKEVSELHLNAIINLGSCYYYQGLYSHAMEQYRKSYDMAIQLRDHSFLFFPLRGIAKTHLALNEADSALIYFERSFNVAQEINDSLYTAAVLTDIAMLCNMQSDYVEANRYISKAIDFNPNEDYNYYYLKGDNFSHINQYDSAQYYLRKSLNVNNIYTYVSTNYALYNLEKSRENYKDAVEYADNYILYYDSIQHQLQQAEIAKLMDNHALESHKKEVDARQQQFMLYSIIVFLVFISICVYVFFHFDRSRRERLIVLQQDLMHNRSQLLQLQSKLTTSTTEMEMKRHKYELVQQQLQLRQKDLCMRLFQASPAYRVVQDFISAKRQKKLPKELLEKDRLKIEASIGEIYVDFIQRQQQSFPQLSQGDIYCCTLAYMGFSNSLIGYLMGVDPNVVTQRRYRIKGKMDETAFNLIFSPSSSSK